MTDKTTPAYFIFDVKVHNSDGLKPYQEKVESTYKRFGGKRIVLGGQVTAVEGHAPQGRLIMLQFDSVEQAHAWHDSPEYQDIIHYRHDCTETNAWLVEGCAK